MSIATEEQGISRATSDRRRRRVLVSAIAVSPTRGSEAGIGWNIGSRLARHHDVTLMCVPGTTYPHRKEIEAYLKEHGLIPGLTMLFVEETPLYKFFDKTSSSLLRPFYYVGYASWQRAAYRKVRELHAENPFELTHHLNILGYREPGYLWKLPIPFFWGPVAGASNMPWSYFKMLSWRDRLAYGLRNIANEIQKRIYPRPRKAARAAAHIWAIGEDNRQMFTDVFNVPAECLCEAGGKPRPHIATIKTYDPQREPLRLVFAGYHIGRKAVPLVLHAIARIGNEFPVHFTSLGSGPERAKWQALAQELGIADKVNWIAELPHEQAMQEMSRAHLFAFPSLQEASSTVTLEALSLGLPVICHDACGMGFIVNDDCGVKVAMTSPEISIEGIAGALRRMHSDPSELTRLSHGALKRSEELSWDYAAQQIAEGYDRVLSARASK
ncbi:MAG TPA: glycosyltransferase [Tepidisphaeraceae bacterium]|nr:glycosyltransferase [Tepidisphaeraceae bacterium]